MKNRIILAGILFSFISGALVVFSLPSESSVQIQQLLYSSVNTPPQMAFASSPLTNVFAGPSNNILGLESHYAVTFNTATNGGQVKSVDIVFPSGFDVSNALVISSSNEHVVGLGTLTISGQKLTYNMPDFQTFPAGYKIVIELGNIINAKKINNQISVTTRDTSNNIIDGPTNSATFTLTGISTVMLNNATVGTTKMGNGQVTLAKLAPNSVDSSKIVNGSITRSDISSSIRVIDCTNLVSGALLIGCDLHGMNLHGKNLNGTNLSSANLAGTNLSFAILKNATIIGANLNGANFAGADLSGANLDHAKFPYTIIGCANLNGANLAGANLAGANLGCANLGDANLGGTDLQGSNLSGANLTNSLLTSANLVGANIAGTNLANATLYHTKLNDADISYSYIGGVDLSGSFLSGANFFNTANQPTGNNNCIGTPIHATFSCVG